MEEHKETVKPHKSFIITILIIIIVFVIFAGLSYFIKQEVVRDDYFKYNSYEFERIEDMWYTQIQVGDKLFKIPAHFSPKEVEDIPVKGEIKEFVKNKQAFVTFDPEGPNLQYVVVANGEFGLPIVNVYGMFMKPACTKTQAGACDEVDIITCNNTEEAVIYLKDADSPSVNLEDNCLIIAGKNWDIVRATDRALYEIFGIM